MEMSYIDRREAHVTLHDDAKAAPSSSDFTHSVPFNGFSELLEYFCDAAVGFEPKYDLHEAQADTSDISVPAAAAPAKPPPNRPGDRPNRLFACLICDKQFWGPYALEEHVGRHAGTGITYACRVPRCRKAFTTRANLRRHEKAKHRSDDAGGTAVKDAEEGEVL